MVGLGNLAFQAQLLDMALSVVQTGRIFHTNINISIYIYLADFSYISRTVAFSILESVSQKTILIPILQDLEGTLDLYLKYWLNCMKISAKDAQKRNISSTLVNYCYLWYITEFHSKLVPEEYLIAIFILWYLSLSLETGGFCAPVLLYTLKEIIEASLTQNTETDEVANLFHAVQTVFQKVLECVARRLKKQQEEGIQVSYYTQNCYLICRWIHIFYANVLDTLRLLFKSTSDEIFH